MRGRVNIDIGARVLLDKSAGGIPPRPSGPEVQQLFKFQLRKAKFVAPI